MLSKAIQTALITTVISVVGAGTLSVFSWANEVNKRLTVVEYIQLRLDSIDNKLVRIEDKLDKKVDKK